MTKTIYTFMVASAAICIATSSQAASTFNPDGSVTLQTGSAPFAFQYDFNGFMSSAQVPVPGLESSIQFNFLGTSTNRFNFSYTLLNLSSGDIDASRLTIFGFNSDPNLAGVQMGSGDLFNVISAGNQPNGLAAIEVCFKDAGQTNNCTGAKNGVAKGGSASGTFSLAYNPTATSITLSGFTVRYQGIYADGPDLFFRDDSASGVGTPNIPLPEPATWAMMITGFGLTGAALRRRRSVARLAAA